MYLNSLTLVFSNTSIQEKESCELNFKVVIQFQTDQNPSMSNLAQLMHCHPTGRYQHKNRITLQPTDTGIGTELHLINEKLEWSHDLRY